MRGVMGVVVILAGCYDDSEPPPVLEVTATATWCPETCAPLELPLGFSGEVWATFHHEGGLELPATEITWSWEPHSVIDLPAAGAGGDQSAVLAVGPGSATVTVRNERHGIEDTVGITVRDLLSIAIDPPDPQISAGGTITLTALGNYQGGNSYDLGGSVAGSAEWTSDNPVVATIEGGVVTGIGPGQATISAGFLDATGSTTVTVNE
jgi:hypothetical protein